MYLDLCHSFEDSLLRLVILFPPLLCSLKKLRGSECHLLSPIQPQVAVYRGKMDLIYKNTDKPTAYIINVHSL